MSTETNQKRFRCLSESPIGRRYLDRARSEPRGFDISGFPPEWYTLSENMYRAYNLSGDLKYKSFGDLWRDEKYWALFADPDTCNLQGYHAYSHANSLSSAAMTYAVTGDPGYLELVKSAYDHFQNVQCYATGGFGPAERLIAANSGELGRALEREANTFETPCGSWAVFKLGRYLIQFTGEARYGDWIERLMYNGIGGALPMGPNGSTFYYSDYRLAGLATIGSARKQYYWAAYPCCSGTYIQDVADFHNIIYFRNDQSIFVNLFVPSEVVWRRPGGDVVLRQETLYPEQDNIHLNVAIRVPQWARGLSISVNGEQVKAANAAGWAIVERRWQNRDEVIVHIPMQVRSVPVDQQHPKRVAIMYGPVVLVQDGSYTLPLSKGAAGEDLSAQIVRVVDGPDHPQEVVNDGSKLRFRITNSAPEGVFSPAWGQFMPFYAVDREFPYRMYFDLDEPLDAGVSRRP
jgi:hypothetical protein